MSNWVESYKAMFKDAPAPSEEEIERLHNQWLEANPEWLKLWEAHKHKLVVSPAGLKEIGQWYENIMTWPESPAEGEGIRCKIVSSSKDE